MSLKSVTNLDGVLSNVDTSYVLSISGELQRCHENQIKWRTRFIMENGILNDLKFPLPSNKFFQCVREQLVFYEELLKCGINYTRADIERQILELKIKKLGNTRMDKLQKKLLEVDIIEKSMWIINIKRDAKERVREIKSWQILKDKIIKENPKLDINNQENSERESWLARWNSELKVPKELANPQLIKDCLANLQTYEGNQNG